MKRVFQNGIYDLKSKSKTVIIIAHRMRTVAGADKIVVIKDGREDEQGKPSELKAKNGVYSKMLSLQQNP